MPAVLAKDLCKPRRHDVEQGNLNRVSMMLLSGASTKLFLNLLIDSIIFK